MNYITLHQAKKRKRKIGPGQPVFIIAEMSGNHNQSLSRAKKIIDVAAEAGADAIKLQTYTPDTITMKSKKHWFRIKNGPWKGKTLHDLYQEAHTPWEWQPKLKRYAKARGLIFFSTPFDETAVDFLEKMCVPLYKIASFEIVDIPLLKKIAQTKKPIIISRGMASINDITLALETLRKNGTSQIAVLHCVSAYPAKPENMNLATIGDIARRFRVIAGLSDHTLGIETAIAGVVLGAHIIEKHLTLRRRDGGPDAKFSLEPKEFSQLVQSIRAVEEAVGTVSYQMSKSEASNLVFRRSLFAVKNIKIGEKFSTKNVRSIRPGYGLPPKNLDLIISRKANRKISKGTPLSWNMVK